MIFGELALISAAGFSGAAIYVNVAEQPARRALEVPALLAEWKLSYKRGFAMQAPLAVVGCIFGLLAWRQIGDLAFIAEAVLMIANWPWTLLGIKLTNNALMGMDAGAPSPQTRALIVKWGKLHAVRSALGTAGPSRKRVVSPTEREMPRERKGESRQRQLSFGAPNVRTRLPPPAWLTRVTEHSLRRLLKDFELFGFAVRNSKSSPYSVL